MNNKVFFVCGFFLVASQTLLAQTQHGYTRTIGRPNKPGEKLEGVVVRAEGVHNAVLCGKDGLFIVPMTGKRAGDMYSLRQVQKTGYELADQGVIGRKYAYSDRVPLTVVMVSTAQLQADKQRIADAAYQTAERNYHQQLDDLDKQLSDSTISEDAYRTKLHELQENLERYQGLIEGLADHYARTDYALLDEKEREVSLCIERGDLERADLLLSTMFNPLGVLERNREALADANRRLAEGQGLMEQAQSDLAAVLRQQEKDAEYLHQLYTISIARFDNEKALRYIETRAALDTTNDTWQLEAGKFIHDYIANYDLALNYYNRIVRIQKKTGETNSTKIAAIHNSLGMLFYARGNYDLALNHLNTVLSYHKQQGETVTKALSSSYNNIATVYSAMGNKNEALNFYKISQAIDEQLYGKENLATSTTCNNIGSLLSDMGKHNEAMEYYQRALSIRENQLGTNHLSTAMIYHNLGYEHALLKDNDSAIYFYQKALKTRKQQLGENHPEVASTYNGIGVVYVRQKNYDSVVVYLQNALDIRLRVYGENNLLVATTYNNLGYVYTHQRDYAHALECYEHTLSIREALLGLEHIHVAEVCTSLGTVEALLKDYSKAMEYYYRALKVSEIVHGLAGEYTFTARKDISDFLLNHNDAINEYVYTFIVLEGDSPSSRAGMYGEYIVLEMADWTIESTESLFKKNEQLRGKPKTIVVMKDGEIKKYHFDNTMGVAISLRKTGMSAREETIHEYHRWRNSNN